MSKHKHAQAQKVPDLAPETGDPRYDAMIAYARRVYGAQSESLSMVERKRRIQAALQAQGYGDVLHMLEL